MAHDFRRQLAERSLVLFDGAMGTMLMAAGLGRGEYPEAWNATHPDAVREVARLYAEAGADVVTTNTFGANPIKLAVYGKAGDAALLSREGARLAREGAGEDRLVAGSMGPTGGFLQPLGDLEPDAVRDAYAVQAAALTEGGADLILVETMTDAREARLALEATRLVSSLPVGVTLTFDRTPRGFFTIMGVSVDEATDELRSADFLGTNCGNGMDGIIEIIDTMSRTTGHTLLASANAGVPRLVAGLTEYPETPEEMAANLPRLLEAGATFVGGCCGTSPATIRAFRKALGA